MNVDMHKATFKSIRGMWTCRLSDCMWPFCGSSSHNFIYLEHVNHCPKRANLLRRWFVFCSEGTTLKACSTWKCWNSWEQCSTHLLMLTFSKKPVSTGISDDTTNGSLWRKLTAFLAYTLYFNTRGCLFRLCNISHFQNGDGQRGGTNTKVSVSPFPPWRRVSRKWCPCHRVINSHENHRLAGRQPSPPPLPPPPTDNYRSPGPAAMLLLSVEIASCYLRAQESDFN